VPALLVGTTVQQALHSSSAAGLSINVGGLAEGVLKTFFVSKMKKVAVCFLLAALFALGTGTFALQGWTSQSAEVTPPTELGETKPPSPKPGKEEKTILVKGRVLDPDGKTVKDAEVAVLSFPRQGWRMLDEGSIRTSIQAQTKVDHKGRFQLQAPRPAGKSITPMLVMARAKGYGLGLQKWEAGQAEVVIRLPKEQVLRARLVDLQGQPVKGIAIHVVSVLEKEGEVPLGVVQPAEPSPLWFTPPVTDDQGRFALHGIGPKQFALLEVRDDRFQSEYLKLWTTDKERSEEVLHVLAPARLIEGKVTYADTGKPIAGVEVVVEGWHRKTDKNGCFRLNPPQGRPQEFFFVVAHAPEGEPYLSQLKQLAPLKGAGKKQLDFALPRGVLVRGKVTEAKTGKPLEGAALWFLPQEIDNPNFSRDKSLALGAPFAIASGADGSFQLAVLPGPGHLLVKGPKADYIPVETTRKYLRDGKTGGERQYLHALIPINFKSGSGPQEISVKLRRGVTVRGTVLTPDGKPATKVQVLTRLNTSAPMIIEELRGEEVPPAGFVFHGCDPEKDYPAVFLDEKNEWGALVQISGKKDQGKPLTVKLQRCGSATARFLNKEGKPREGYWPSVEMVVTPGPHQFDFKASEKGILAADAVNLANVYRGSYQMNGFRTDAKGKITLSSLVPGVTYRIVSYNQQPIVVREFTVKPGQTLDLKDLKVAGN
jgi:hypothetical protein